MTLGLTNENFCTEGVQKSSDLGPFGLWHQGKEDVGIQIEYSASQTDGLEDSSTTPAWEICTYYTE